MIIRREDLKVVYAADKVENLCENLKVAKKIFNGNTMLANSLMARINALKQADTIKDIIVQPTFHFHKLINKNGRDLEGYFAIDVKSRGEQWRIILEPLDENEQSYNPCKIDEIAESVRIVEITEVSKHYE